MELLYSNISFYLLREISKPATLSHFNGVVQYHNIPMSKVASLKEVVTHHFALSAFQTFSKTFRYGCTYRRRIEYLCAHQRMG